MNNRPSRGGRRQSQRRSARMQTPPHPPRRFTFLARRPFMCHRFVLAIGGVVALASCSLAQSAAKDVVRLAEVRFADGSVVRMNVLQETIEVATKYGKLTIPTDDIRRIDIGMHRLVGIMPLN